MRQLLKGNEAIIHGAIAARCAAYFGYPITPASEIADTAALLVPKSGRSFPAGRERSGRHPDGLRRGIGRRAGDDRVVRPRHQPHAGGDFLLPRARACRASSWTSCAAARGWATSARSKAITSRWSKGVVTATIASSFLPRTACRRCATSRCTPSRWPTVTGTRWSCLPTAWWGR